MPVENRKPGGHATQRPRNEERARLSRNPKAFYPPARKGPPYIITIDKPIKLIAI